MTDLYAIRDVAELFGLQEARLRYWAQTGIVSPSVRRKGRLFYSFQDVLGVKVARELLDRGVPLARVRKNLEALRTLLPQVDQPLAQLRICSDGDELVVLADDVAFQPASGQLVMSFAVRSLHDRLADVVPLRSGDSLGPADEGPATAYGCFLAALEAEEVGDDRRAERLYRRTLQLDDALAAAWTNLGSVLERRGGRGEARDAFERALALDPEQPEARYNLANLLADLGELDLALAEYRQVTVSAPDFADAHFNLALLLLRVGATVQARAHLERYLSLDADSPWAEQARACLRGLPPVTPAESPRASSAQTAAVPPRSGH